MAMGERLVERIDRGEIDRGEIEIEVVPRVATPITFSELYAEMFRPLVRTATLMTGRVEVARDVVQDAFVKLHVKWLTVHDPAAYVRRSVINGCRSHHRRERRRRNERPDLEPSVELAADDTLSALASLPHRQRAVVVLKFYEGRTEREIAEIVGCRPGSVGPTVHRALATLRTALEHS